MLYEEGDVFDGTPEPIRRGSSTLSDITRQIMELAIGKGKPYFLDTDKEKLAFHRGLVARIKTIKDRHPDRQFSIRTAPVSDGRYKVTIYRIEDSQQ